ncbi:uncharacterized protein [Littorina saxatilis]|uniref:uncharacterized protein n=1 Tax=Littorina saxatilis TaxID=31220 RepID=UPI0038B4FB5B
MAAGMNAYGETANKRLFGAWMEYKSAENNKWGHVWCVLRDNILFFFSSEQTSLENHIGTLHLSKECSFHYTDGNAKEGYKFELHIAKKKKKFRVRTVYERELWRAYMEGVITGTVPQGVILSPSDTQDITSKLHTIRQQPFSSDQNPSPPSSAIGRIPQHSESSPRLARPDEPYHPPSMSGMSLGSNKDRITGSSRRPSLPSISMRSQVTVTSGGSGERVVSTNNPRRSGSVSSGSRDSGTGGSEMSDGGPVMRHKFRTDGYGALPPWFFENCDRDLAKTILTTSPNIGNTLMRVSCTARNTGSYVISKRTDRSGDISHYEVIRVAEGYKINVDNCNQAMKTLTEVMEYFTDLAGRSTTRLVTNNNLEQLGIENDYSRSIQRIPEGLLRRDINEGVRTRTRCFSMPIMVERRRHHPVVFDNPTGVDETYEDPVDYPQEFAPPPPVTSPFSSGFVANPLTSVAPPSLSSFSSPAVSDPGPLSSPNLGSFHASLPDLDPVVPVAPPPPPMVPPPAPPASSSQTWGRTNSDAATGRQGQFGISGARTQGHSFKRTISGDKQSAMQVHQQMQEHDVLQNLDTLLAREERSKPVPASGDKPPPVPPCPVNRPKLGSPDARGNTAVYQNQEQADNGLPVYVNQRTALGKQGDVPHPRWNHRSQSVPNVVVGNLDRTVPANIAPPSVIRPGGGEGKVPPPTAPKSSQVHHPSLADEKRNSVEGGKGAVAAGPGVNSVMSELQMRLQGVSLNQGALRKTGINLVDGPNPPVEQQAPPDDEEDDDEMYEDLNNVYQNA